MWWKALSWHWNLHEFISLLIQWQVGHYLPDYIRKVVTPDGFANLTHIPGQWKAGRKVVWVWWQRVAWPQQSPDGGWRPGAGVAFKFLESCHYAGYPAWLQDTWMKCCSLLGWMLILQLEEALLCDFILACCWDMCATKGLWHKAVGAQSLEGDSGWIL